MSSSLWLFSPLDEGGEPSWDNDMCINGKMRRSYQYVRYSFPRRISAQDSTWNFSWKVVPSLFSDISNVLDSNVYNFLNRKPEMQIFIWDAYRRATIKLRELGVKFESNIRVDRDVEDPTREDVVIEFEVEGRSYEEILSLWDEVAKEAFNGICKENPEVAGKIEVVLRQKKR